MPGSCRAWLSVVAGGSVGAPGLQDATVTAIRPAEIPARVGYAKECVVVGEIFTTLVFYTYVKLP